MFCPYNFRTAINKGSNIMITKASAKYIRISPRKTRKVMDLIRGMSVIKAEALMSNLPKRPCIYIKRVLKSAVDSADKLFHIPASSLYISLIKADQGPIIKRFKAASMGRASEFLHRTSHIVIELDKVKVPEKKVVAESEKTEKKTGKIEKRRQIKIGAKRNGGTKSTSI